MSRTREVIYFPESDDAFLTISAGRRRTKYVNLADSTVHQNVKGYGKPHVFR